MKKRGKCIFITGMGHSGTRLMSQMFSKHPDISVPLCILNNVHEFTPAHEFFKYSMDKTPLNDQKYHIDFDELAFIMDAYMDKIDESKKFYIFKLPYYPLNCLDFFIKYFENNIVLLNVKRPKDKVINSFISKGEGEALYLSDAFEFYRQLKKLDLVGRKKHLVSRDPQEFFCDLYDYTESKVCEWNNENPSLKFMDIDIEKFASSKEYLAGFLADTNLSGDHLDEMRSVVDKGRLFVKFTGKVKRMLPRSVISLGSKLFRENRI